MIEEQRVEEERVEEERTVAACRELHPASLGASVGRHGGTVARSARPRSASPALAYVSKPHCGRQNS